MERNGYKDGDGRAFTLFSSFGEFADACERHARDAHGRLDMAWVDRDGNYGGTLQDALGYARHGDLSYVSQADRLIGKIDENIDTEGLMQIWAPSVVGSFALVPAYIAGTPEAMLARTDVPDARGDLEVWVELGCPWRVSVADMRRRGVCVMAAIMALSRVRNVRVVCFTAYNKHNMVIPLQYPLDLSEAFGVITQPCVKRRLTHGYTYTMSKSYGISVADWNSCNDKCRSALAKYAGMQQDAEIVTRARLNRWGALSDDEMVVEINAMLNRIVNCVQ